MNVGEWNPVEELVDKLAGRKKILVAGGATFVAEFAVGGKQSLYIDRTVITATTTPRGNEGNRGNHEQYRKVFHEPSTERHPPLVSSITQPTRQLSTVDCRLP